MEWLRPILSVETTILDLLGYQMSAVEAAGTALYLWSVWLAARNRTLTWPVGNVAVILFAILFYQIRLYSDLVEQAYYLVTGFYGWWAWARLGRRPADAIAPSGISRSGPQALALSGAILVAGTASMGFAMGRIHIWLPAWFPEPASFAYLDALTTVASFVATILLAHRKIESWYLWIGVDVIGIGLYAAKGVYLLSILYAILLCLAVKGLVAWRRSLGG